MSRDILGSKAYTLRRSTKKSWVDIADVLDSHSSLVYSAAHSYARQNGLPWPIGHDSRTDRGTQKGEKRGRKPRFPNLGAVLYAARCENPPRSWSELVKPYGITNEHGILAAKRHAAQQSLPWPIPRTTKPKPQPQDQNDLVGEKAYTARLHGASWKMVAWIIKSSQAYMYAHKYALNQGLAWPIRRIDRDMAKAQQTQAKPAPRDAKKQSSEEPSAAGLPWPVQTPQKPEIPPRTPVVSEEPFDVYRLLFPDEG